MTDAEKAMIARQLLAKISQDITVERSYHGGNAGAQKALDRIDREVTEALERLQQLDDSD